MKSFYYNGLSQGNHMLEYTEYNWNCPECGVPMQSFDEPETKLCDICQQLTECKCCATNEPFVQLTQDGYVCKNCGAIAILDEFNRLEYYLEGIKL